MSGTDKLTRGRQKIAMKIIENNEDLLTTFSKRRSGIYKKASEVVTMCGADVGLVVFSPAGNPFSFGHPSVESVINRFLNRTVMGPAPRANDVPEVVISAHQKMRMNAVNENLNTFSARLEEAKEMDKELKKITRATTSGNQEPRWWEKRIEELSQEELRQQDAAIERCHRHICGYLNHHVDPVALGLENPPAEQMTGDNAAYEAEARIDRSGEDVRE